MPKSLTELTVEIAVAQSSHETMSADEMKAFLNKTFQVLQTIKAVEEGTSVESLATSRARPIATDPNRSIQRNKIICLECGKAFNQLTQAHLKNHGITTKAYRKKYGFSARQPLSAKTLTTKRRKAAKEIGLGEKLIAAKKAKAKTQLTKPATKIKIIRRRRGAVTVL